MCPPPKANLLLSPCIWPPVPFPAPTTSLWSPPYCRLCLWGFVWCSSYVFICCFQFYIPHVSETIWFLTFSSVTCFACITLVPRPVPVVTNAWECKLVQTLCKTVRRPLKKLRIKLPYDPATPLLGSYSQNLKTSICKEVFAPLSSSQHYPRGQDTEATEVSLSRWLHKGQVVQVHNGTLVSHKKRWTTAWLFLDASFALPGGGCAVKGRHTISVTGLWVASSLHSRCFELVPYWAALVPLHPSTTTDKPGESRRSTRKTD